MVFFSTEKREGGKAPRSMSFLPDKNPGGDGQVPQVPSSHALEAKLNVTNVTPPETWKEICLCIMSTPD